MLRLKVEAIRWELPDAATLFFSETSGIPIPYQPGQFITLVFDHHKEEIRRSYSLSSIPGDPYLAITIKRIPNGEISRFLLSKIEPGDLINAVEPAGRFVVTDPASAKDLFFFAAGSGIVPIYAQLRSILAKNGESRLILIYSNSDSQSVLFKDALDKLAATNPVRLKIIHLFSSDANRLTNLRLEQIVKQNLTYPFYKAEFYTCGPFDYMRMIRLTLTYMGADAAQIMKENFVLDTVSVTAAAKVYPPRRIRIRFNNEAYDLLEGENQSILQTALQNGIPLPYSCRTGDCSTCSVICKSGKVEMVKNNVLTEADLAAGWVLTCTGHAVTDDVEIAF
jgi:ring-1,2-phenylacetyl-CoA epoxidase subunit PaaE